MYAVFKTGGKQYRATTGDVLKVEKIEAEKGATIELDQVLMVGEGADVKVGAPYLEGGKVTAMLKLLPVIKPAFQLFPVALREMGLDHLIVTKK